MAASSRMWMHVDGERIPGSSRGAGPGQPAFVRAWEQRVTLPNAECLFGSDHPGPLSVMKLASRLATHPGRWRLHT